MAAAESRSLRIPHDLPTRPPDRVAIQHARHSEEFSPDLKGRGLISGAIASPLWRPAHTICEFYVHNPSLPAHAGTSPVLGSVGKLHVAEGCRSSGRFTSTVSPHPSS